METNRINSKERIISIGYDALVIVVLIGIPLLIIKLITENYLKDFEYAYLITTCGFFYKIIVMIGYYSIVPLLFKSTYGKRKKSLFIINSKTHKPASFFQLFVKFNFIQPGYLFAFIYQIIYLLDWKNIGQFISHYTKPLDYIGWFFLAIHILLICFRPNKPSLADRIAGTKVVKLDMTYSEIEEIGKD